MFCLALMELLSATWPRWVYQPQSRPTDRAGWLRDPANHGTNVHDGSSGGEYIVEGVADSTGQDEEIPIERWELFHQAVDGMPEELRRSFEAAPAGAVHVVDSRYRTSAMGKSGWRNCNMRTQFERIVKNAGLKRNGPGCSTTCVRHARRSWRRYFRRTWSVRGSAPARTSRRSTTIR